MLNYKQQLGCQGSVARHDAKLGTLLMRAGGGKHIQVNANYGNETAGYNKLTEAYTFRIISNSDKYIWLEDVGFGTEENSEYQEFADELARIQPLRLQSGHVGLWWKDTRWSLQMLLDDIKLVNPSLSHLWGAFMDEFETNPEATVALEKQRKVFHGIVCTSKLVLVPVFSSEHWTLMAIDMRTGQVVFRYYDTSEKESAWSRVTAERLLKALNPEATLSARRNSSRQTVNTFGFAVSWYIEEEARHFVGEGWGARGRLCENMIRSSMHALRRNLTLAESQMRKEERLMKKKMEVLVKMRLQKARRGAKSSKVREDAILAAAKAAAEFGDGLSDIPRPLAHEPPPSPPLPPPAEAPLPESEALVALAKAAQ